MHDSFAGSDAMRLKNAKEPCTILVMIIATTVMELKASTIASLNLVENRAQTTTRMTATWNAISTRFKCDSTNAYNAESSLAVFINQINPNPYAGNNRPSKNSQLIAMFRSFPNCLMRENTNHKGMERAAHFEAESHA
ncbi:hypothetical protein [Allopusillimonas ginsengisoli]|uniref:hypothetical protein n=1 Tax=Allopusillimonas ginsengisoli TaxID=453575 RepID=UPI00102066AF|nr:hypothetical protein [Allopusillimonas ginsengisoli]TEA78663.1 hypothetical protein ERE07_09720 [Allopusillimonas ginsengisoli]